MTVMELEHFIQGADDFGMVAKTVGWTALQMKGLKILNFKQFLFYLSVYIP